MSRDDPLPLRDALAAVSEELGLPAANMFDTIVALWHEVVGTDGAGHSRVRSVRNGECTIEVDSPAWATRARYLTGELLRRANEPTEEPLITSARVVVSGSRSAG